jgi:serine/threonine protein kinase
MGQFERRLGHYGVVRQLGAGGMGTVYLAEDLRLGRQVALKVLSPEWAGEPDRLQRFEREARALAALNHPNVVTIYSVEEADGQQFITMELIDGKTLSDGIPPGGMPVEEILGLAVPLADALDAAHQRGIIHRDLKPANVMITAAGRLKVLDFGLAKLDPALSAYEGSEAPTVEATRKGMLVGTLRHMSPEQLEGKSVDRRSDLFSLGIILYEMATAQRPFDGGTPAAVIACILRQDPIRAGTLRRALPASLDALIHRCLEKDPARRLQTAAELRAALLGIERERADASSRGASRDAKAVAKRPSIAVLPFVNMSADKDQEYFCDGMAEEILNGLAQLEGLDVSARTSSFAFKGRALDIREIGGQLGVDTILEGSVRRSNDRLRITAQLIKVVDGYHVWSERYDRERDRCS